MSDGLDEASIESEMMRLLRFIGGPVVWCWKHPWLTVTTLLGLIYGAFVGVLGTDVTRWVIIWYW